MRTREKANRESMKRRMGTMNGFFFLALGFALAAGWPVRAEHGSLASTQRDPWIDSSLQKLMLAGWASKPDKPLEELTNLEVAQLTAEAAKKVADLPPSATPGQSVAGKSLNDLLDEFDVELSAMDVEVSQLEDRLANIVNLNGKFSSLQAAYLGRTGTQISGYSRAYFDTYRGFGANAIYGPMDYNDIIFADLKLRSVPVPFVLFDADLRVLRTIGLIYGEVLNPEYDCVGCP